MNVRVGGEAFAEADARGGLQHRHAGTTDRHRRCRRHVRRLAHFGRVAEPLAAGRTHGGNVRVSAPLHQQRHRRYVAREGRTPQRRGANLIHAGEIEVVLGVPDLARQPRVRIGALVEQRLHVFEVGRALLAVCPRLRIERARRPGHVQRRIERRDAVVRREIRVGALLEQPHGQVEVSVDGRNQQGGGAVAGADLVDVGARGHQHLGGVGVSAARGEQQRGRATLRADQLVIEVGPINARGSAATAAAAPTATAGSCRGRCRLGAWRDDLSIAPLAVTTGLVAAAGCLGEQFLFGAA